MDIITNYENYLKAFRMAKSTCDTYLSEFKAIKEYFAGEDLRYLAKDKMVAYLARLFDLGYSPSKVNQAINSFKFYREKILGHKPQKYYIRRPKRDKFVYPILSQEQMFRVIDSPKNLKHRTLLYILYMYGLRISEIISLKLSDVLTKVDEPHLVIQKAKHNSNRFLYLTPETIEKLQLYYKAFKPKVYLFEGAEAGKPISKSTIANVLKAALKKQGVKQRFRVHDVRHNFATHCLLNGTGIYDLSLFLGHRSVETTEKYYAHVLPSEVKIHRPQRPQPETEPRIMKIAA